MNKITLLVSVILLTFLIGCITTRPPLIKPITKQHSESMTDAMSKYRSLLINSGWNIESSNISDSDGFLKAIKSYGGFASTIYSITVSCSQNFNKINCVTTLGTPGYPGQYLPGRVDERALNNKDLKELIDKIKAL